MSQKKIVVVEDEPDILELLVYHLRREGYEVSTANNGVLGLSLIKKEKPDLVVLDLMLPGMNGIDICRALKRESETSEISIIMLTAKGEESDIVLGLGAGADDYVTKPFSPKELVARIQAHLRRKAGVQNSGKHELIDFDPLQIDARKYKVTLNGDEVKFTATEFRLLHFLASNPGRVFSRDQLISNALGDNTVVVDRNIDVHVRGIRKKLDTEPSFIETIRGVGYRFMELD